MKITRLAPAGLFLLALISCSHERYQGGGGFETGDIQACVFTSSGRPAQGAMVWLVRSLGDSAPAAILDSSRTDQQGLAYFELETGIERASLSLDAQLGDSLGITRGSLQYADTSSIHLKAPGVVQAWLDSSKSVPKLFVAGSHFTSIRSETGNQAILRLPRGTWDIVARNALETRVARAIKVDSTPTTVGFGPWSTKRLVWKDSLTLLGTFAGEVMYGDSSLPAGYRWTKMDGAFGTRTYAASLVREDSEWTSLNTVLDSSHGRAQWGSGITSPQLPPTGALTWQYWLQTPPNLGGLIRVITLADAAGNGLRFELSDAAKSPATLQFLGNASAQETPDLSSFNLLTATNWSLVWNQKVIELRSDTHLIVRVVSGFQVDAQPNLSMELVTDSIGLQAKIQLRQIKLYQPR